MLARMDFKSISVLSTVGLEVVQALWILPGMDLIPLAVSVAGDKDAHANGGEEADLFLMNDVAEAHVPPRNHGRGSLPESFEGNSVDWHFIVSSSF